MHYFIYSTKDSYITENSSGQVILYPDSTDRNYGGDEILELKKGFVNSYSTTPYNVSRMLTQFDYSDISASIVDGTIIDPKFYLRYYEVEGQSESDKTYSLSSHAIPQTWEEGVGKHFDNPKTTGGVTWKSGSSVWVNSPGGDLVSNGTFEELLGSELVSTIENDTGGFPLDNFVDNGGGTYTGTYSSGTAYKGFEQPASEVFTVAIGEVYKLTFNYTNVSGADDLQVFIGNDAVGSSYSTGNGTFDVVEGDNIFYINIVQDESDARLVSQINLDSVFTISNISIKKCLNTTPGLADDWSIASSIMTPSIPDGQRITYLADPAQENHQYQYRLHQQNVFESNKYHIVKFDIKGNGSPVTNGIELKQGTGGDRKQFGKIDVTANFVTHELVVESGDNRNNPDGYGADLNFAGGHYCSGNWVADDYLEVRNVSVRTTFVDTSGNTLVATSGSRTTGGGSWVTGSNSSQSFVNQSGDIEMDVTDIVNRHLGGANQINNYGFMTKFSGSYEDDGTPLNLKFFSRNTHTVYAPKLEVMWDDSTYDYNGTFEEYEEEFNEAYGGFGDPQVPLTELTMSGEVKNHIFIRGLQLKYRESEKVRFRIGCRKKYVQKTFTESVHTSSFHVPVGSGSYSIIDASTNTPIVPFSDYTKLSADITSMYFDQWLNTFEPGRYYKVLFKLKYNDGQEIIYDNDEEFKVI